MRMQESILRGYLFGKKETTPRRAREVISSGEAGRNDGARFQSWHQTGLLRGSTGEERVDRADHCDFGGGPGEVHDLAPGDSGERDALVRRDHHQGNVGLSVVHGVASAAVVLLVVDDPDLFGPRGGGDETPCDAACHQSDEDADEIRVLDLDFGCVATVPIHDVSEQQPSVAELDDDAEAFVRPDDDSAF